MSCSQCTMESGRMSLSGTTLTSKPSAAFLTSSFNTSGSRLLFGEVDSSCDRCKKDARYNASQISDPGLHSICECTINMWSDTLLQSIVARVLGRGNMSGNAPSSSCAFRYLCATSCVPWHQRTCHQPVVCFHRYDLSSKVVQ